MLETDPMQGRVEKAARRSLVKLTNTNSCDAAAVRPSAGIDATPESTVARTAAISSPLGCPALSLLSGWGIAISEI